MQAGSALSTNVPTEESKALSRQRSCVASFCCFFTLVNRDMFTVLGNNRTKKRGRKQLKERVPRRKPGMPVLHACLGECTGRGAEERGDSPWASGFSAAEETGHEYICKRVELSLLITTAPPLEQRWQRKSICMQETNTPTKSTCYRGDYNHIIHH